MAKFDWDKHDDVDGEFAPWWGDAIGDVLVGEVVRIHEAESQFGGSDPVVTIASNGGEFAWRVRSVGALRAVKAAGGIQPGDHVRVERLSDGESTGKGNAPKRYKVQKGDGDEWSWS